MILLVCMAFVPATRLQQKVAGAWIGQENGVTHVLLVTDNYLSLTAYNQEDRLFLYTLGGPVQVKKDQLELTCEFHSLDTTKVGTPLLLPMRFNKEMLTDVEAPIYNNVALPKKWKQLDYGTSGLSGNWQITKRMQEGSLQTIHQTGSRKTIKLLTGTRFQWVAIDPGAKGFYGTGGGEYTFKEGKYTEHIAFFSRDSSRVGASLSFNGKLENGAWHHSGKSSRGDHIYEVWTRK
ncbi:hypothetical protein SAMN05444008_1081 [Cnuella takakiae]|uniref:Membrane or secreted protein n=1 Tax=Cnuella takakiae TaxID=1302690 RepID=A0A1M5BLX9_9BACT|nr:hypothetical protein [Cnuella takakiae]SHF43613.1 hypothetical protein SAMN05444008_1081 [Cnuella takakiae]